MPKSTLIAVAAIAAVHASAQPAGAEDLTALTAEAKGIAMEFANTLKSELKSGLIDGGPESAIEVCNRKAPEIAKKLEARHGWRISRTSLRLRNEKNAPDPFEKEALRKFDADLEMGADPSTMMVADVVETSDGKAFRFVKAIPVASVCLGCHGESLDPDVAAKLAEMYPGDDAIGYQMLDLRGAFTLEKPL